MKDNNKIIKSISSGDVLEYDLNNIDQISEQLIDFILKNKNQNQATIVELDGDMGYGKTTLIANISKILGITEKASSPTFVYVNEYNINKNSKKEQNNFFTKIIKSIKNSKNLKSDEFEKIIHIDAYRVDTIDKQKLLQINYYKKNKNFLIFIEWNSKLSNCKSDILFAIDRVQNRENQRSIKVFNNKNI